MHLFLIYLLLILLTFFLSLLLSIYIILNLKRATMYYIIPKCGTSQNYFLFFSKFFFIFHTNKNHMYYQGMDICSGRFRFGPKTSIRFNPQMISIGSIPTNLTFGFLGFGLKQIRINEPVYFGLHLQLGLTKFSPISIFNFFSTSLLFYLASLSQLNFKPN